MYEILPTDMGKVFHKTMELVGKRSDWKFADDASRDEFVELMVEQAVTDIQKELFESSHRNEYVLERMKRISKRAVWAMEQHIKRGEVYKRQDYGSSGIYISGFRYLKCRCSNLPE